MIVLIVVGWWLFSKPPSNDVTGVATSTGSTSTSTNATSSLNTVDAATGEEVTVQDQPAGDSVRVAEAKLSRVSWIAVRDDLRIYGAARVTPPTGGGTVQDITVPLLRNTTTDKTYKVVVYADDGDGIFDFKKDLLVSGLEGSFMALNGD